MSSLLTVGHGTLDRAGLTALLTGAGVETLVDVRRFPGSRRNLDVSRDALPGWLPEEGIAYRWEERLGGRRRLPAGSRTHGAQDGRSEEPGAPGSDPASPDTWWRVEAFRAYASWTRTQPFRDALDDLLDGTGARTSSSGESGTGEGAAIEPSPRGNTAIMCSESVWWRCHRRVIADVAALARDVPVWHLMHDGRLHPHVPSDGARLVTHEGSHTGVATGAPDLIWDGA